MAFIEVWLGGSLLAGAVWALVGYGLGSPARRARPRNASAAARLGGGSGGASGAEGGLVRPRPDAVHA